MISPFTIYQPLSFILRLDAKMHLCYNCDMRTTITINDKVYRALKMRAAESNESISTIVEDAVKFQMLEDLEDIEEAKRREDEPSHSFDELIAEFKKEGLL
jgi:predicted CopG family antitoxin